MKRHAENRSMAALRQLPAALSIGMMLAASAFTVAHAGTFTSDFNSGLPTGTSVHGNAFVDTSGGIGDSGVLKLVVAQNSQQGSFIINDLDGGAAIAGFSATFKMLIGNGNVADGLSFNFANDLPDASFGEEGAGTGLTVSFDTYDNGNWEAPAIDVKLGGSTLATTRLDLSYFRTGTFLDVVINLGIDNRLDVTVNGVPIYDDLFVPLSVAAGRFGFGARTGGLNDDHWIDDLSITTTSASAATPIVRSMSPVGSNVRGDATISFKVLDGTSTQLKAGSARLLLNGVTATLTSTKSGAITTLSHTSAKLLPPGLNAVVLTYTDTSRNNYTFANTFEVSQYIGPNGHVYEMALVPSHITWPEAKIAAEQRKYGGRYGHLATITSYEEDLYLENLRRATPPLGGQGQAWVGAFQVPGSSEPFDGWTWINGEGSFPGFSSWYPYANWHWAEPNNAWTEFGGEHYLAIGLYNSFGWNDDGAFGEWRGDGTLDAYIVEYEPDTVQIDIQPGEFPNVVNASQSTRIPVAILSSATFNAALVDGTSLRFGQTGTEAAAAGCTLKDVNGDKRLDLVCDFSTQETAIQCGDTIAQLRGQSKNGWPLQGSDSVKPILCNPYSLSVLAMQDVNKNTDVQVTVNVVAQSCTAPTLAQHILLRSVDLLQEVRWSASKQNVALTDTGYNSSTATLQFPDLRRFQEFDAAVQVKNCNALNTVTVRGQGQVLLRPDLNVAGVSAPQTVYQNSVFNPMALINERNGDLGGSAVVYLMEGENVLDVAYGIGVAAFGTVGVTFTTSFASVGTRQLTIMIGDQDPGDFDTSNNRYDFSVEVTPPVASSYASYQHVNREFRAEYNYPWWEYGTYEGHENYESVYESMFIPAPVAFPLDELRIVVSGDGDVVDDVTLPNVAATYSYSYEGESFNQLWLQLSEGTSLYLNSYDFWWGRYTTVEFSRTAVDYMYYSEYHNVYYGYEGVVNDQVQFGSFLDASESADVRIVIQSGGQAWGGTISIPVYNYPFDYTWDYFYPDSGAFDRGYNRGTESYGWNSGFLTP